MEGEPLKEVSIPGLVTEERLVKYLGAVARRFSSPVMLHDLGSGFTMESVPEDGGGVPPEAWDGMRGSPSDGPGIFSLHSGGSVHTAPVMFRGSALGTLGLCSDDGLQDEPTARNLAGLVAEHVSSLCEAGYESDSLAGEVVRVYEELAIIYGITAKLGLEVEVEGICRVLAAESDRVLGAGDIMVQLADTREGVFRTVHSTGLHEDLTREYRPGLEEGLPGHAYVGHRSVIVCEVDQDKRHTGWPYPIRWFLTVPLIVDGMVIGLITATDKLDQSEFDSREEKLVTAMAAVTAIAIRNAQLYSEVRGLLEGFIKASVTAVESRDPTTAGHSARVATLSVELAMKVGESDNPAFRDVSFSRDELMELHYAGILHDFGKIGVSESALLKGAKLNPLQVENIRQRFEYIKERKVREALERKLGLLLDGGRDAYEAALADIDSGLLDEIAGLDGLADLIDMVNNPRVLLTDMPELDRLAGLRELTYTGPDGVPAPYITPSEFESLSIPKGSLGPDERREIEMHVTHSYNFLTKVPWTGNLADIADIVYAHHEKLDGSGYPRGLRADDIPIQAKIMAVADIYDALTAWDRPYKDSVSTQKALSILEMEAGEGKLDPRLVQIFRDEEVYRSVEKPRPARSRRARGARGAA